MGRPEPTGEGGSTATAVTVPGLLRRNATEFAALPALTLVGSPGSTLTWAEVRDRVAALSRGLAERGVGPGDVVLMMMPDHVEHWLVDQAIVHCGAIPSTVYATLSSDQLGYLAEHSDTRTIVIDGAVQAQRWAPVLGGQSTIDTVVVVDPAAAADDPRFVDLATVEAAGAALHRADPGVFESAAAAIRPEQPVTVLYTSGTTGDPKGVAISHHNVISQAAVLEQMVTTPDHAPNVAYLPLAHIAERMLSVYNVIYRAGHVHFCPDPAQVMAALQQVRPLSFFGVPRIWEKIAAAVGARVAAAPPQQRAVIDRAMELAVAAHRHREAGTALPDDLAGELARLDPVVLAPIRTLLGLDGCVWPASGAAPIPVEVLLFVAGLGITVLEVWGMTETTGTASLNTHTAFRTGSVGRINPGMELRLADDGEILVRGPLVCLGYLEKGGQIVPATDAEGWLATGDVGTVDAEGFLTITDRKKELIITSGGKNIAPSRIENLLRADPLVGYAVAIGDRRPYVTALVVLDEESAPGWAAANGLGGLSYAELTAHPATVAYVAGVVERANAALSRPEQVKRFAILPSGWTAETGELTPKLSLRRAVIAARHQATIDGLYPTL